MMLVRLVIFMIFIVCSNLYSQQGNLDDFDMDYLSADDKNDFDFDISDYLLYDNENDFDSKLYRINSYAEFSGLYKLSNVDLIVDRVILKINLDEIKEYYNENSKKYSDNSEYQDTWLYNYFSENIRIVLTRYSEWVSFFYLYIYARDKDKAFKVLETVYNLNFYLGQLLNKYDRNKFERNLKRLFVEEHYKNPEIFLLTNSQEIKIKGIEKIENNVSHRHILQELNKNEIFKELNDPFMLTDNVKEMIKDYLDNIIINNNIKNLNDISEVDRIYYVYDFLMEKMNLKKSYDFKETTSKFYQGAYDLCLEYEKDGYCTGDCLSALFIYLAVAREMGLLINIAKVVKTSDNIYTGNHFAGVVYLKELKEYITLDIGLTIIGNREKDIIIETDRDALLYNAVYILNDNKFDKRDLFNIITKSYNENNPFILDHYIRVIPTNKEVNSHSEYLIKLINSRIEKIKNHNDQNFNLALYYYYLSLIYYKYERYEESNMYIDMSLNYDSNIMESYKLKGDLCYRLEKHREAINYYRKFVDYENIDSIDKIIEVYYKIAWIYACSLNDKIKFNEIIDEAFKLQRNKKYHLTWSDITVFINYTYVEIPGCSLLIYDDKGALSNIYLSTPIKLNNLLIDKGDYIIKKSISLYDNGYLKYGYLAEDFSIKVGDSELMLKSGEMIAFYETGEINNGCLAGNQEIMVGKNKIKLKSNAKNGKYDIGLYQNGNINYGYLAEDCPIKIGDSELMLKSGEMIRFYETGNVSAGYLAEDFSIKVGDSELNLKSGEGIGFYETGNVSAGYLAEDCPIKIGDNELMLKSGKEIAFYETGEINNGFLAGNQEIMVGKNKIKLKSNAENGKYDIGLYQNGNINYGYLAEDCPIKIGDNEIMLKSGEMIDFYETGNINYGYLAEDCPIKIGDSELNLKSGEGIGFYETGNINYGYLAENFPIKIGDSELNLKSGEGIGFYETGNISYGYLAEDFPIKIGDSELMLKSGEMIRFYETGNISYGYLAEDFPIKIGDSELMLKSGEIITFYETGNVSAGYLAEDCPIKIGDNELMLKSGEIIQFYENGAINVANLTQSKSIVLNGLKYEFSSLNFYPNGKIEGGIVEKPVNIKSGDNILFISGWLSFNELGFITEGYLSGEQNIKINNLLFKTKDGAPIEFFNDGSIRVVNTEDYLLNINNYSFTTNKVKFNQSGEITSANISKPSEIKLNSISYKIPENAKIEFYKEGILKSIIYPENIKIEYNNSNISIKSYCPLAFYKSGKIQSVYLSENSKINLNGKDADINNKDTFVSFHENGNIESISLKYNQEFEIKNKKYNFVFENVENQKTYRINFFNNGMVKDGYLANETNININENIFIAPVNTKISFYENGNVECFNIAKNTFYVENIPISSENISDKPDITLYEDGSIKSVYAVNDFDRIVKNTIYKFRGGNTIEFYKNGIVKNGCINEENSINLNGDIIYIKSNKNVNFDIGFSEDGTISFAYLNNDQKIKIGNNFFNIYDNCYVDFYSTGNIQHLEKIDIKSIKVGAKSFDFIGDYTEPSSVIFYENGNIAALSGVKEGELKIGQNKIKYHSIPGNYTISFYESGEVEAIFSLKGKQNIKIGQNKIIIKGNKDMWSIDFHKNGSVRSVISGEDQNILINKKNIKVKENQILYFDLRGNFL